MASTFIPPDPIGAKTFTLYSKFITHVGENTTVTRTVDNSTSLAKFMSKIFSSNSDQFQQQQPPQVVSSCASLPLNPKQTIRKSVVESDTSICLSDAKQTEIHQQQGFSPCFSPIPVQITSPTNSLTDNQSSMIMMDQLVNH